MTNTHDVREQQIIRDRLQADVDRFVANGGKIETLAPLQKLPKMTDDEDDEVLP